MNNQCIVEKFAKMANLTIDEAANWADLCFECASEIDKKKIKNLSDEEENLFLTPLAATMAFYRYCLYSASKAEGASFKVGDISVKESNSTSIKFAKQALDSATACAAAYLEDDGFVFEQVKS